MGRAPCCDKANVKKGPWSPEEDSKLKEYIEKHGTGGNWIALPHRAGLKRCGKSCRLRWLNYLRPNIKHGEFSDEEDRIICTLYANIGSRWSIIAAQLPGRTDNDIKNYWNTKLKKKLMALLQITKPAFQIPSHDQNPPLLPSSQSLSSSMYTDWSSSSLSFTALDDPIYVPSYNYKGSNMTQYHFPYFQSQESLSMESAAAAASSSSNPMQYYGMSESRGMMFGSEGSCTSSDGSCSQVSHGRESMKQEEIMGIQNQNYICSNNSKFMLSDGFVSSVGQTPLDDYHIQDMKQVISNGGSSNNGYYFEY